MKVALAVNRVLLDIPANLSEIIDLAGNAADAGADLVVFPESALTGLINNDDPSHDLPLGQPIPGDVTDVLAKLARKRHIYLAIGLLEREDIRLYDSAVLIAPDGKIKLKYRRISPRWHGPQADPSVYCQGEELSKAWTPLGTFAFLICGDLFDDELVRRIRNLQPDWLLFPFARCFDDNSYDQERWDREEKAEYAQRVRLAGVTTFMVNYLGDKDTGNSFGGAMVVAGDGTIIDSFPLGRVGTLLVSL